nr:WD repeat- and FYVE domain-containing protein 4 isoform X1 [Myodes glareolus]XP_048277557.1 WD repeat- and FYVE domain-containing protein 4 isoform X1 [Myodes glareolus]XP_048277558.1 WD repeat- and FYVE domain-containing protein 4 isoform X1 [Myodes glareolus]XP_048277559.1 WD repeat- and FYVE domain-containing protein 4 isoform X1 [Myodes glareolus]XP_048277560.1 WD repeat- and FYVE domain-containing protein 4 isoform X1 [Myodes glareolus]XP_048277561.1 WD repeat- and FYVE domain-containi
MEAEDLSKAEDRPEGPGFQNEGQPPAMKPDFPLEGQCPGPTALWDTLEKKFLEYQQLTHKNPEERRKNLLSLLPLFLKAWEHSVGIICFRSLQRLAEDVSDQLAQEIQQALAGKPAEQARAAVGQLLRWKGDMDQDGYLLLKSVYVLTGTDSETLGRVVGSGLPALLLQCLYLFFAFPVEKDELLEGDVQGQRMFVQMLLNICSETQGLEGLLSGSELQSLLIATTCLREHSCYFWKEPTFCVLRAISKAQSSSVIQYLRTADCVRLSVQNLSKLADTLPAPEVSQAVSLILNFVKDSYPISSALLLEFENGEGYPLLLKVLLRYDGLTQGEVEPHLEELLELVMWLTTCGRSELKVFDSVTYPQLEGFKFHHEASGVTVKNLQAFQVLQNVFHRASDSVLCTKVLLAIKTMWAWNPRNFFLLEWTLQPISQFVELVPLKPPPVQAHFFQLLETLVFKLLYVPHEILAKVQHLIKESPELPCTLVALQSILRITASDRLFTDIFRDSGLLGLLLAQLRKQAKIMRKSGSKVPSPGVQDPERELTCVMLNTVVTLLQGSVRNAVVLKDHGMVPFIKIFLDDESYRGASLSILEQLSVINAEEYMSIIVGALCSSTQGELQLKLDLLKSLLRILETPKGHAAFRVSSGFNGLLSLLSDLEGSLQVPVVSTWGSVSHSQTLELVLHTLCVVSAALHLDPVNGHFFRTNGLFEKLAEDLCLLGCFGAPEEEGAQRLSSSDVKARPFVDLLSSAFSSSCPFPPRLQSCLQILSFLDSMASGTLHLRRDLMEPARAGQEPSADAQKGDASGRQGKLKQWPDLEERMDEGDVTIMLPGIICIMVRLLPRLYLDDHPQLSEEVQCSMASHLLSLVKSEKNRQVMCEAGMLRTLMTFCHRTLSTGGSALHSLLIRIFEKLGSQAIEPDVLRQFLGLGICSPQPAAWKSLRSFPGHEDNPGNSGSCADTTDKPTDASPCPGGSQDHRSLWTSQDSATALQTTLSLISMTSPRNLQPQRAALTPSFVEFDMSVEGYGCLFIPTLSTVMGTSTEHSISGGTGSGTPRSFPPPGGLTFSCWFLISRQATVMEGHPLRFLTLVRHLARTEQPFICFSISLCMDDLSLVVSTEEKEFQPLDVMEPEDEAEPSAGRQLQVRCSQLLTCGQWYHLAVVVSKEMKRNCTVTTYLDGQAIGSAKMLYVQALPGTFLSMDPSSFVDVYGYIGTPRIWKQKSSLIWRLGPAYLFEEDISVDALALIIKLGPRYCGNFQAVHLQGEGPDGEATPLIAEERVSFGLHVSSSSITSIMNIRNTYNEVDSRLIAKEMNIASRDNATPVFLLRNCAGHLSGSLRTLGAVAVGQLGVRVFHSSPAASSLDYIGGPAILLGLISLATDDHTMYAAVKVLHSVLTSNAMCDYLMQHICGYQILAFLLRKKTAFLNHRIFQLILSVAGTAELGFRPSAVTNTCVFQHVLCNFELWTNTADNLELALFSHLLEILQSPREGPRNAEVAHQAQLVPKLIFLFNEPSLALSKVSTIIAILGCQLKGHFNIRDLLRVGLFVIYTLKPSSVNERQNCLDGAQDPSVPAGSQTSGKAIWLRNQLLEMLFGVISSPQLHLSSETKEQVFLNLGPDWFLLLLQGHLHPSTTTLALKLLLYFLSSPSLRGRFRDGLSAGCWVECSMEGVDIVMDNLKSRPAVPDQSPCLLPGFQVLNDFLAYHVLIPEVYLIVSSFFLQTPLTELTDGPRESLDSMLQWLLQKYHQQEVLQVGLCTEGALMLLGMIKAIMSQPPAGSGDHAWERTFPRSILQFLGLVQRSYPQDPAWRTPDFLQTLAIITFPLEVQKEPASETSGNTSSPGTSPEPNSPAEEFQDSFKSHPARRQLREFMQILLRELLLGVSSPKQWLPLEVLLEASPDGVTSQQKRDFQSEVLLCAMDIFYIKRQGSMPTLRGSTEPQANPEAAAVPSLASISYFTQKLVEKLYSGMFSADPRHILLFIIEHIVVVIESPSSQRDTVMSALYSSLNKVVLHCLSKPQQSLSECLGLLRILDFLQEHWDIIFATYNSNVSFLLCLMHCLLLLNTRSYPEGFGLEPKPRITPYHQVFLSPSEEVKDRKEEGLPSLSDVQHNIQKSVRTLWQQLVAQRRQTLEDAFKIDLSVKAGESEVKIEEVTPLWEETMLRTWQHYLASEKKSLASRSSVTYHSKVTSWSGSLSSAMRLMPGRQAKDPECRAEDFVSCIENYRRKGQELYASLYRDYVQRRKSDSIKAAMAWARIQEQLFGELGLWGQMTKSTPCSQWELDRREGPARMRKRIRRLFSWEVLNQGECTESQDRKDALSQTNAENQVKLTPEEAESRPDEVGVDCTQLTFFPALHESLHSEDFLELCKERQIILQELLDGEKVSQKVPLVIVQGHLVSEGILLFGQQHFYICENFTLSPTGDVYCTRHCLSNISDPFIFNMCSKDRSSDHYSCQRYAYSDLRELRQARFLLQDIALEVFFQNGDSKLLVFYNSDRGKAFKSFCTFQPSLKGKGNAEDPFNLRRHPGFDRTMLQKWQKRELSNFEYLMYLNILAGRTYNDYMQYPVFPWVLADYTSEMLNLTNPKTFRDLSKPMGAQTKERKLKFTQRFKEVEKIEGDMTVQCHYYTHYSSAIIVASYLVRMPPFTQAFCSLQGGSFDVADRMFHSVKSTWESASKENMSDVRELTPEFFYLPEFLTNCNSVEFGRMQDGTTLGDVQLPPWADGDPRKFISLHRQALESDFVSGNLHHWIDLVFGCKQQGQAAVEAVNTFHPYFYGDRIDLTSISDPLIKSTILGFISNFGQVPKQIFTKPHPSRNTTGKPPLPGKDASSPAGLPGHSQSFLHNLPALKPSQVTVKDMYLFSLGSESPKGAIGHIVPTEKTILAVEKNKMLLPPLWNRTFSWGFDDFSCCLGSYGSDKILMTFENLAAWGPCLCAVCPSPTMIVTSGASAVVCVWELSLVKGRPRGLHLRQALYGHTQAVTCLTASVTFSLLVSGSQDRTCILWDLDHFSRVACLPVHREGISAVAISDVSGTIVSCAGAHLSLWDVNGQPLASITTAWGPEGTITCCCIVEGPVWDASHVIVTGSKDGMVRIWKTEDVKMSVPRKAVTEEPSTEPLSPRGHKWAKNLALSRELDVSVALSGKPSKTSPAVTALAITRNQTKLLVGDEKGRIFCWSADG